MENKKIYHFELSAMPTSYTIEASNVKEAEAKAREWYKNQFNGRSAYGLELVEVELLVK